MKYIFEGEKVFFTSDTHFWHRNIIAFCNRPFGSVEEMNETIIARWNRVVGDDDVVFHLGDFALGNAAQWNGILHRLHGHIYLIEGNHDRRNLNRSLMERFELVASQLTITVDGRPILLHHYPFLCYEGSYDGVWQLFGHVHSGPHNTGLDAPRLDMLMATQYDVGVDNNNFTPVSYAQVKEIIESQIAEAQKGGSATR